MRVPYHPPAPGGKAYLLMQSTRCTMMLRAVLILLHAAGAAALQFDVEGDVIVRAELFPKKGGEVDGAHLEITR